MYIIHYYTIHVRYVYVVCVYLKCLGLSHTSCSSSKWAKQTLFLFSSPTATHMVCETNDPFSKSEPPGCTTDANHRQERNKH